MRNDFRRALHRFLHREHRLDQVDDLDREHEVRRVPVHDDVDLREGTAFKRAGQTPRPGSSTGSLPKNSPSPASQPARHFLTSEQEDIMTAVWFVVCVLLVAIISWRLP